LGSISLLFARQTPTRATSLSKVNTILQQENGTGDD
jgi:hypothetical protein